MTGDVVGPMPGKPALAFSAQCCSEFAYNDVAHIVIACVQFVRPEGDEAGQIPSTFVGLPPFFLDRIGFAENVLWQCSFLGACCGRMVGAATLSAMQRAGIYRAGCLRNCPGRSLGPGPRLGKREGRRQQTFLHLSPSFTAGLGLRARRVKLDLCFVCLRQPTDGEAMDACVSKICLPAATMAGNLGEGEDLAGGAHSPCERLVIEDAVAQVFGVQGCELRQSTRGRAKVARARQVAMYLAHVSFSMTLTDVGRVFDRDRTTVSHACGVIEDERDDPIFDRVLELLEHVVQLQLAARQNRGGVPGGWLLQ